MPKAAVKTMSGTKGMLGPETASQIATASAAALLPRFARATSGRTSVGVHTSPPPWTADSVLAGSIPKRIRLPRLPLADTLINKFNLSSWRGVTENREP